MLCQVNPENQSLCKGIVWTPICLRRTLSGLARNTGVGRYRPRLSGGRYWSGSARRTHIRLSRPKWTFSTTTKNNNKTGSTCLTFNRFELSSGESGSGVGLTSRDHSRHLGFSQLSGFRKGHAFLNADTLNLLLLLPDRAIFSRWSVGTIAIRAQLGSLISTIRLIVSATRTFGSNLATLARVARHVAVEATHRVGNKQGHLHL